MITFKSTAARMSIPALMFSILPLIGSCQKNALYISNKVSEPHELAAYNCHGEETTKDPVKEEEDYDETMAALACYLEKEDDDNCATDPEPYCFEALTLGMPAPNPCPTSHCIPFLTNPLICFYSQPDKRRVEIFVNGRSIGTARDVSYNSRKKLRTVSFDLKKNFRNTAAKGQNDLSIRIPVTYPARSAEGKPTGDMTQTHLEIAAKF